MARKQQGGRARGKRSTPLHQALSARDIAGQLRTIYTYLDTVHSLVMVAGDALQAQAADNDTDVAAVLKHFAASSIFTQMERIKLLIALCEKALSPRRTERRTFRIPTKLSTAKG
jgi:hypothetical protein